MRSAPVLAKLLFVLMVAVALAACGPSAPSDAADPSPTITPTATATAVAEPTVSPAPTAEPTSTSAPTSGPQPSHTVTVRHVELPLAPSNSTELESLLGRVPEDAALRQRVEFNNYASIRDLLGLEPPSADAGSEELLEYMRALVPPYLEQPQLEGFHATELSRLGGRSSGVTEAYEYLAFDARNVDQTLRAWGEERRGVQVTAGRFDPSATEAALVDCSGDCVSPEKAEYAGVGYFAWESGSTLGMRDTPPLFESTPGARRVLVQKDAVYDVPTDEDMESVIDTIQGEKPSMLDFEDFSLVARGLAGSGANSAVLTDCSFTLDAQFPPNIDASRISREAASSAPFLKPFTAAGAGMGFDGERNYGVLALYHADEATAEENVERLAARIRDGVASVAAVRGGIHRTSGVRSECGQSNVGVPAGPNEDPEIVRTYWRELVEEIEVGTSGRLLLAKIHYREGPNVPLLRGGSGLLLIHETAEPDSTFELPGTTYLDAPSNELTGPTTEAVLSIRDISTDGAEIHVDGDLSYGGDSYPADISGRFYQSSLGDPSDKVAEATDSTGNFKVLHLALRKNPPEDALTVNKAATGDVLFLYLWREGTREITFVETPLSNDTLKECLSPVLQLQADEGDFVLDHWPALLSSPSANPE